MGTNWNDNFWAFPPFFRLKRGHNGVFLIILNFYDIFSEFFIMGQAGTDRNDNFYYHSISGFPTLLSLEKKAIMVFFNFLNFFFNFLEFFISGWVETDRNDNFYFHSLSSFPNLFWLEKKPKSCFFFCFFVFFFSIFLGFFITGRVGTDRNDNFYFHCFSGFPTFF